MSEYLNLETLLRVPCVEPDLGFDISPDGSTAAFSWNLSGRWEIYTLDLTGDAPPRQITTGDGAKFAPRWSPDGGRLAYALDLNGGEDYDIYAYTPATGKHVNLTPNTPDAITTSFAWSPNGEEIAFCSDRAGRFDTYIMPSTGGEARKVLDQPSPDWVVHWSPDGKMLAVMAEGAGQDYWTFVVPLKGEEPYPITLDGEPICAKSPCWSPDSRRLIFASNQPGEFELGILEIESKTISWLTFGEAGEKEFPAWSADGQLAYVINHGPKTQLAIRGVDSAGIRTVQIEPGVIYSPHFDARGKRIFFVFDNPRHPDDLWYYSLVDGTFTQVTHSLPAAVDQSVFAMPQEVYYPSLDGSPVPALLYRPAIQTADLPPGVLYIHGGPNWLTQVTWDPLIQHMVSRGWVVLAPNYRGSTGYGKEWQLGSRFDLGGVDTEDVVAGANYLDAEKIAHPDKIAVTGRSWGGYLTMTCLTQHPDRWAAGSAVVPFLNWFTGHAASREDLQHWDRENFGDPETNREMWYERSPFFFLDRIEAPVQLICGENDVRCPAGESAQAHEKLTTLGKVCDYVLFLDEGHSFLKIENQIKAKQSRAEFLAKYL